MTTFGFDSAPSGAEGVSRAWEEVRQAHELGYISRQSFETLQRIAETIDNLVSYVMNYSEPSARQTNWNVESVASSSPTESEIVDLLMRHALAGCSDPACDPGTNLDQVDPTFVRHLADEIVTLIRA